VAVSRLDSAIRRLQAQRACLDWAADAVAGRPGPVLELGLGNGRTFDHLRGRLPEREIFVFERSVAAHPDCIPDDEHLLLGDFHDSLPGALARIGARAVMAHCDIGSGNAALTAKLAAFVGSALAPLLAPGAVVVADQALEIPGSRTLPLPPGVAPGRYHLYRLTDAPPPSRSGRR
jgi:tRNA G46 methylase TrmB